MLKADPHNEAGLKQLLQSDLALSWMESCGGAWNRDDLAGLAKAAVGEGFGEIQIPKVHQAMLYLRDQITENPRRVNVRTSPTVAIAQTVDRLATAGWAHLEDFAARHSYEAGDIWLNRTPDSGMPLGITDDRHVGVFGQTRGGKGITTIIPQHCLWQGSLVSIDPSGENATITAMRRGDGRDDEGKEVCIGLGQTVHVIDPFMQAQVPDRYRKRFNPLDTLDPDDPDFIEDAAVMAEAIVELEEGEKDPVWNEKARKLVHALIMHIKTAPHFREDQRNLVTLRELALLGDREMARIVSEINGEEEDPFEALFAGMRRNTRYGLVIPGLGEECYGLLVKHKSGKQWTGFHSALTNNTEFLDSPKIQRSITATDFSLRELQENASGTSLFVCLSEKRFAKYKGWLRMMVYLVDAEVRRERGTGSTRQPVLMCIDEFGLLGTMKEIGEGLSTIAKYGMQYFLVMQNLPQLQRVYPESWDEIMDSFGVTMFAAVGNLGTAKWISERCGETDLVLDVRSVSQASSQQHSQGTSKNLTQTKGGSDSISNTSGSSSAVSVGVNSSTTDGISHTESSGSNRTHTAGTNQSSTAGTNRSRSFGSNASNTFGTNTSFSSGTGTNQSISMGESRNENFRAWKFFRSVPENIKWMRDEDETTNLGESKSASQGTSTNTSESVGENQSQTTGTNRSDTAGTNQSDTVGRNQSDSVGVNRSESDTINRSNTVGHNRSTTRTQQESTSRTKGSNWSDAQSVGTNEQKTTGHTDTSGHSETWHKRPLISPDDVMLLFSRGKKGDVHQVGLGLVMVDGERPMIVDRTAYFVDPAFEGLWVPSPEHLESKPAPLNRVWDLGFAMDNAGPLWDGGKAPLMGRWLKQPGDRVEAGEPICEVVPGPTVAGFIDDRVTVSAPVSGVLESIERGEGDPFEGFAVLGSIGYHLGEQL